MLQIADLLPKGARIHITQTYQIRTPPMMHVIKPLMVYFTSVDFGKLVTNSSALEIFSKCEHKVKLVTHSVIKEGYWQNEYHTVLEVL